MNLETGTSVNSVAHEFDFGIDSLGTLPTTPY